MRALLFFKLLLFILLLSPCSQASVEAGVGSSSVTSGRIVPTLNFAYTQRDWTLSTSTLGVKNSYSYQSAYTLAYFSNWKAGTIFSGDVTAGFGLGTLFIQRGFRDATTGPVEESNDVALGPAFKINYYPFSSIYFGVEAIFGIRDLGANLTLNFQDVVMFSFGVSL